MSFPRTIVGEPAAMERATRGIDKPVVFNYLLCPYPDLPEEPSLSTTSPAWKDPAHWKSLADDLQSKISDMNVPKSIKAFIGNDAFDLIDMSQVSMENLQKEDAYDPFELAMQVTYGLSIKDFRAGVIKIKEQGHKIHLQTHYQGLPPHYRPPVMAFFLGLRFNTWMQAMDYLPHVTQKLLGLPDTIQMPWTENPNLGSGSMPKNILFWLEEGGRNYSGEWSVMRMPQTRS